MPGVYYQRDAECAPREKLAGLQDELLVRQVKRAWDGIPYYRKKMQDAGVSPSDIKSAGDLGKLPFVTKEDLRLTYPDGFLAVPKRDCVRVHSTSGTTGKRVIAFYTAHDVDVLEDCCARALVAAGASADDVCQIAYGYGLFTGGAGFHGASHRVGCMTVPMSSGNTGRQIQFMEDLGVTFLCCTPSYAAYLAENVRALGKEKSIRLKAGVFGAEAWSEEMRRNLEDRLGIRAFDVYGLTELGGPGVAYECAEQHGMHVNEDHYLAEVIDPDTCEVLPYGSKGELVFTSLDKEAFPLIRYRTHDICVLSDEKCGCGRTFVKMSRPMGRSDDMLIVRGVNVFPSQIESVLMEQGYRANYQVVVDRADNTDSIEVKVEMAEDNFSDSLAEITDAEKRLVMALKDMLGISVKVRLVAPKSILRSEGKAVRVIDRRKI